MIKEIKKDNRILKYNPNNNVLAIYFNNNLSRLINLDLVVCVDKGSEDFTNDYGLVEREHFLKFYDLTDNPIHHPFESKEMAQYFFEWIGEIMMEVSYEPKTTKTKTVAVNV